MFLTVIVDARCFESALCFFCIEYASTDERSDEESWGLFDVSIEESDACPADLSGDKLDDPELDVLDEDAEESLEEDTDFSSGPGAPSSLSDASLRSKEISSDGPASPDVGSNCVIVLYPLNLTRVDSPS